MAYQNSSADSGVCSLMVKGTLSLQDDGDATVDELKALHKTLKKVSDDIERLNFNTCVSAFMVCVNDLDETEMQQLAAVLESLVIALAPFAPHITEELWLLIGKEGSVHHQDFPAIDESYLTEDTHTYPVSVNGKVRAKIELPLDTRWPVK